MLIFFLILLQCGSSNAQLNMYDFVQQGRYQAGYTDTLILDEKYSYQAFDYNGRKPYFVQIWHPVKKMDARAFLKVKDFFSFTQYPDLKIVQEHLRTEYRNIFIREYLTENLENGSAISFGKYSVEEVLNLIGEIETRSVRDAVIGDVNFPVIVYYNGSQGLPFENYAMAEYFASRGFIFVSASFELQFENHPFGMLPYERFHSNEYEECLKTITRFAGMLSHSPAIFFIGHSLGAQMGLRTFGQDTTIKGMVSLETTIEFKEDTNKIKEMWPEVYQKIAIENTVYPFPVLLCAATGKKEPFTFFRNLRSKSLTFASTNEQFEHNAYTSLFYLRYFLDINQPDKAVLLDRLRTYVQHLELIEKFLGRINSKENLPVTEMMFLK